MIQIRPVIVNFSTVPKAELASLHIQYLPTPFMGKPGIKLLELFYNTLSEDFHSFGFAAVLDGKTIGFSCAVKNVNQIQTRMFKQFPFFIIYWAFRQMLERPKVFGELVWRLFGRKSNNEERWLRPPEIKGWYTYRPVVVDEPYRKYRIADLLTNQLIKEARYRKIPGILAVVAQSNIRSLRHFSRNDFFEVWKGKGFTVLGKDLSIPQNEEIQGN